MREAQIPHITEVCVFVFFAILQHQLPSFFTNPKFDTESEFWYICKNRDLFGLVFKKWSVYTSSQSLEVGCLHFAMRWLYLAMATHATA
jgi:hypothetical protein